MINILSNKDEMTSVFTVLVFNVMGKAMIICGILFFVHQIFRLMQKRLIK